MIGLRRRPKRQWPAYLAKRAVLMEWRGYQALWRLIARRPRVPEGATAHPYHQPVLGVLITFIVVSALEVVLVDVALSHWFPPLRIPLLLLGVWGVVWMLGLLAGMLTRPHAVGPDGIRVRSGAEIDIPLGWADIASVQRRRRSRADKEPTVTTDLDGRRVYHLRISEQTNIDVDLEGPTEIRLPHGSETVERIALYAEDPAAVLRAVRELAGSPA